MWLIRTIIAAVLGAICGAAYAFVGTGLAFLLGWSLVGWLYPGYTVHYQADYVAREVLLGSIITAFVAMIVTNLPWR